MAYELRPIVLEEFEEWTYAMERGFAEDPASNLTLHHPVTGAAPWVELDRSVVALDGDEMVGTSHSYTFDMAVPGGSLPIGAISHVCVQPTHRRRGIMTSMMRLQLTDFYERGEPLSGLNSSETIIYGRYGYNVGAFREDWSIDRQYTAFNDSSEPAGYTAFVTAEEADELFPGVFKRATAGRPGAVARSSAEWGRIKADPPETRRSASEYFRVAYYEGDRLDGYVIYRVRGGELLVHELMSVSDAAYSALWRFCFNMDLRTTTIAQKRPLDDPMPWMLADPRRLRRTVLDSFWLRLVNARAALAGRTYSTEDRLTIQLRDTFCPWNEGRLSLEGGPGGTRCCTTTRSPDIGTSAKEMGSTFLGTVPFTVLARAGLAEEYTPGALERADAMFSHSVAPWCPYNW